MFIIPAPVCEMRMINEARYTETEVGRPSAEAIAVNLHQFLRDNVELQEIGVRLNMRAIRRYMVAQVIAFSNIPVIADLFVNS